MPSWPRAPPATPRVVIADWATLAAANPEWFGPDGTHLAIDGTGLRLSHP